MTKNKNHIIIKLSEHYKNSIASRAAIINLFTIDLTEIKTIEIDFSYITFISRSATHQFIKEKERLENTLKIKADFINLSSEVKEIFDLVAKSIESPKPVTSSIHRVHFSTPKEFQSFLTRV